ncbi:MAG TPA: D-alanine--D-alanine ligase [Gemmatimonadaceae bacterium]|nr:D-alanine--D-alanine ligase [Gemmatimonadaceae bacterium]
MKVTVLLGGASSERDVSMASGLRIADALRSKGHDVSLVDPAKGVIDQGAERALRARGVKTAPPSLEELRSFNGGTILPTLTQLPEVAGADVLFLALHGGQGEDGTIQAMLDMAKKRYTGSGHLASALAMDKDLSKVLFRAAGVGTPDWLMAPATREEVVERLGLPVVVKPSKQGSTVGLAVVKKADDLAAAIDEAFRYDDEVMIEEFIPGRELTVGILGDEVLPVGEIISKNEIYDYEAKYTAGMAVEVFPADIPAAVSDDAQRQAMAAFRALKLGGYARIDFRMAADNSLYCLEANTLPGMTELSLIPQAAAAVGISFADFCERIVQVAAGK